MKSRISGGKIKFLSGNVHHRHIVFAEITVRSKDLLLRHLKAQALEIGRRQTNDLLRFFKRYACKKVGVGERHTIHDHIVRNSYKHIIEILCFFFRIIGKGVFVLAVLISEIPEVHSVLCHYHIGNNVVSEKVGFGKDSSHREYILGTEVGKDHGNGRCHNIGKHDDNSTFATGAIVKSFREFYRKGGLATIRRTPYCYQFTHCSPPPFPSVCCRWGYSSDNRPAP